MELQTIETFLKAAANQNISRTADQLGYSQSAVTAQIQKLEKQLSVQLFERIGKRIYLTEQGNAFIPYANDLLKAAQAAQQFNQRRQNPGGQLRIGGVESVCTALLPELLLKFYNICPQVEVIVRSGSTNDMLELLNSNDLDVVFTLDEKILRQELRCTARQEEEIIFVTLGNDRGKKEIPLERLCREPFILTERQASYRYELERHLAQRDLSVRPILEIGNTETIINLLKKGMGISFLPRFTVQPLIEEGTLMELHTDLPAIKMHHQLLCHKGKWVTPQLKIFTDLVRQRLGMQMQEND